MHITPIRTPAAKWYGTMVPGVRILDHPSPTNIQRVDYGAMPYIYTCMRNGMYLDQGAAVALGARMLEMEHRVLDTLAMIAGRPVNPESSQQVAKLLYDEMGLHKRLPKLPPKTAGGQYTTGDEVLTSMLGMDPVVELIVRGRELNTLRTTFVEPLPGHAARWPDGRIRTTLKTTTARTGRLASEEPNLQNIPVRSVWQSTAESTVLHMLGVAEGSTIAWGKEIRGLFKAWNTNCPESIRGDLRIVSCDLSQIEMRLAAHMADDPLMSAVFWGGGDIHKETAAAIFRIPLEEVTKLQRLVCKTLGFAILYGVTGEGLQSQIFAAGGPFWEVPECDNLIQGWYEAYQGIRNWTDLQQYRIRRWNMVWDMFGRWRMMPEGRSPVERVRQRGYREGGNFPIQSGAQGILKLAMRLVMEYVIPKWQKRGWCIPLMQIHDELLFEVWGPMADEFAQEVRDLMSRVVMLGVPVDASSDVAGDWGSLK